jgi:ABC-2 type transport system ATP-binding protein
MKNWKHHIPSYVWLISIMSIIIKSLSKSYGKTRALAEINLHIREGESVGLVGLNGAGKTTLLKTIVGLIVNFEGEVLINGLSARDRQARAGTSFLPEDFSPPLYLTGYDFISYMLRLCGGSLNQSEVDELADMLELQVHVLAQPLRTYSKGMRQKLGLLTAMLPDREIIILDEPLSGLDPGARVIVKDALGALRKRGKTLFFSSHILTDIEEIADRLVIIHEGMGIFDGSPEELRSRGGRSLEEAFLQVVRSNGTSAAMAG